MEEELLSAGGLSDHNTVRASWAEFYESFGGGCGRLADCCACTG